MLRSPKAGGAAAIVIGLLLLVAPLAMSLPSKAADADQLNTNLKPVYTQALVTNAAGALATIGAIGTMRCKPKCSLPWPRNSTQLNSTQDDASASRKSRRVDSFEAPSKDLVEVVS